MLNLSSPYFYRTAILVIFAEIISLFGAIYPEFRVMSFVLVAGIALFATLERLEWGILILAAELAIGSKGYLFALPIADTEIPIRIALWCIILAVWLVQVRTWWPDVRRWLHASAVRALLVLLFFVVISVLRGWYMGHALNHFFLDLNAWFFFALAGPILTTYRDRTAWTRLLHVVAAASLVSALKVLGVLYIFTHDPFGAAAPTIYRWVRTTGVGEMAKLGGGLYRIFFQSQLWTLSTFFGIFIASCAHEHRKDRLASVAILSVLLASIILSFSRSLWVAGSAGLVVAAVLVQVAYGRAGLRAFALHGVIGAVVGTLLIYGTIYFPFPQFRVPVDFAEALEERVKTDDVATASRWNLLPRLWDRIAEHWVLGSGFGATVTYRSTDPRIVQQSAAGNSFYTTYAFEWGYLDLWLKLGIPGLIAYGALLIVLLWRCVLSLRSDPVVAAWIALSVIVVAVTHIFTPYLNHPLGIAVVLLALAYAVSPLSENKKV